MRTLYMHARISKTCRSYGGRPIRHDPAVEEGVTCMVGPSRKHEAEPTDPKMAAGWEQTEKCTKEARLIQGIQRTA